MKKITALMLAALLIAALVGYQRSPVSDVASGAPYRCQIGIALPGEENPYRRWERDGQDIKKQLEAKGYTVELVFADNNPAMQDKQIKELTAKGCNVLIIASVESGALEDALQQAKAAGVTVIAYDRPLANTVNVDYYVTFDLFRYGALASEYIADALGLKDGKGPFNIELFTGSLDDGNVGFYYEGAMSVLRPYIESGQLVVRSGQIDMTEIGTDGWKGEHAKTRMDNLLAEFYAKDKLDAVLSPNDSIALGIISSLEDAGYTEFPLITGMDCDKPNVVAMKTGKQSMSVFRDTRILSAKVVEMVDALMTGRQVPLTGTEHHSNGINFRLSYNGVKQVPAFLCDPVVVTADSIQKILIDGGYYTVAELGV